MRFRLFLLTRHCFRPLAFITGLGYVCVLLSAFAQASTGDKGAAGAMPCGFDDTQFDVTINVRAFDEYQNAIAQLLKQQKFSELDCLADAARTGKTRFPGGAWKLRYIYLGLESPRPGHPTQEDWNEHFRMLERWQRVRPKSITSPIALAESYVSYAWDARGNGTSDSVSKSGWKLFEERNAKAKAILDDAASLGIKCPDWFVGMQSVAQGQSWTLPRARALLEQATAFEPAYQYYYRLYANYVTPKWRGQEGDAARFAQEAADRIGGDAGDLLYFQIADGVVCSCNDDAEFSYFSWPRLQKGFAAVEKQLGVSLRNVNSFALMASKSDDWVAADAAFKRIGENWDEFLWTNEDWFKQNRDSAARFAPVQARNREAQKQAETNMQSAQGKAYRKEVEQKLVGFSQACVDQAKGSAGKFEINIKIGEDGSAEDARGQQAPDGFGLCLLRALYVSHATKQTPFPPPPHASYWVPVQLDPATVAVSTK